MAAEHSAPPANLRVKVTDAQGLRLMRGGEIRLIITLCAWDDPDGATFGAKVTPWLEVPDLAAPQWRPRETMFSVGADRCFQAEFVDSAYLNIDLYQRGHVPAPGAPGPATTDATSGAGGVSGATFAGARSLNWSTLKPRGLDSALQKATAMLNGPAPDRGEVIGSLRLPVGKQLVCGAGRPVQWVELLDDHGPGRGKTKGSLLLDVAVLHPGAPTAPAPPAAPAQQPAAAIRDPSPEVPPPAGAPGGGDAAPSPRETGRSASPPCHREDSPDDSVSEGGAPAGVASDSASASEAEAQHAEAPLCPDILSPRAIMEMLAETPRLRERLSSEWLPPVEAPAASFDEGSAVNIFSVNSRSSEASSSGRLKQFVKDWSGEARRPRIRPLQQRLRTTFDSSARQQRDEVKKWRKWHEEFCLLNEIEQRLNEAARLLLQASASMKRFGEKHATLSDPQQLSAFLRDAALYSRSESEVPARLEYSLGHLERVADDFRSFSLEPADAEQQTDLQRACEDLQVDIAVLLESALMTAQQALAEYKKMHCRLELLVTEYEPVIRLELAPSGPVFLPLVTDERQRAAVVSLPEQALEWALDFSQLAGSASRRLGALARELDRRRPQLRDCAGELRSLMLRLAAGGEDSLDS